MMRRSHHIELPCRSPDDRLLGGVCGGLGEKWRVDATLLRLAFLVLSLAWGLGVLAYGVLWVVLPPPQAISLRDEIVGVTRSLAQGWHRRTRSSWPWPLDRGWIAIGLIGAGVVLLLGSIGAFTWLTSTRALGLAVIIAGAAILLRLRNN